ncbi:MAG: hypothetical protein HKN82_17700 [Akkermansiaceae bacterium]|nr:hypothetical protein [Akkermansiaceae bacterium]NNM30654.1 hypothetical protein [Akkermansiaceae bacterium]
MTSKDIPAGGEHLDRGKVAKCMRICAVVAVVGTVLSVLFLLLGPEKWRGSYAFSWLLAFFYFLTITLGGCFWTLLHNVSNSGWGTSVRRIMENVGFVFPFMLVFALPLLLPEVQRFLYEWMELHRGAADGRPLLGGNAVEELHHSSDPHDHLLYLKSWFLSIPFWYFRFFFYFGALGFVIWRLRKWSIEQDTDPNPGTARLFKQRFHSAWGIPILAVCLTFAAIDWVMGLDYTWFSTMWGVYVFAGSALNAMAVIIFLTLWLRRQGYLEKVVSTEHYHLMGKLAFTFTVFWAYISFSQFFLIWYANITEETRYFLLRNTENWNVLSIGLVALHFFAPFLLLIRSDVKKKPGFMLFMSCYLLSLHLLDVYHMIIPERGPSVGMAAETMGHEPVLWIGGAWLLDIVALVIIGCGFLYFLLRNLTSAALYPHRDPRILESANVHN